MIDKPNTPPLANTPVNDSPTTPPTLAVVGVVDPVLDASRKILGSLYNKLNDACAAQHDAACKIQRKIQSDLLAVEALIGQTQGQISAALLSKIGYAASQIGQIVPVEIDPAEVRDRAMGMPYAPGGLPPTPEPPGPYYPLITPPLNLLPAEGGLIGVPGRIDDGSAARQLAQSMGVFTGPDQSAVPGMPIANAEQQIEFNAPAIPQSNWQAPAVDPGWLTGSIGLPSYSTPATAPSMPAPPPTIAGATPASTTVKPPPAETGRGDCAPVTVNINCKPCEEEQPQYNGQAQYISLALPTTQTHTRADCGPRPKMEDRYYDSESQKREAEVKYYKALSEWLECVRLATDDVTVKPPGPASAGASKPPGREYAEPLPPPELEAPELLPPPTWEITPEFAQAFIDRQLIENTSWQEIFATVSSPEGCALVERLNSIAKNANTAAWSAFWRKDDKGAYTPGSAVGKIAKGLPEFLKGPWEAVAGVAEEAVGGAVDLMKILSGCDSPLFNALASYKSGLGVVERWAGIDFRQASDKVEQLIGQLCASGIPTTADAHRLWTMKLITEEQWKCLVRSNNDRDDWQEWVRFANMPWYGPLEAVRLALTVDARGDDKDAIYAFAGLRNPAQISAFERLYQYVPPPGDLVRFMVRDVFDDAVALKYGYDDDLADKFKGQALDWARAQGIGTEQFIYQWRAHWQLPSAGQAYDMLHRLRSGRVDQEIVTTKEDVAELLQISDIPTFWRERLIALSYRPLTRVDTRRAYYLGALSEYETYQAILDLGYADREARALLKFWQFERVEWLANRPWAKAYVRGEISDDQMLKEAALFNLTPNQQDQFEQTMELRSDATIRKDILRAVKRRVVNGMTTWESAAQELRQQGYSGRHATRIARGWDEVRKARGKHVTGAMLCKMRDRGLIDAGQQHAALVAQGYSPEDATRIILLCSLDLADKGKKKTETAETKEEAEKRKAEAERLRLIRAKNAEVARAAREAAGLGRAEERVQKKVATTLQGLAKYLGGKPSDYRVSYNRVFDQLHQVKGYSRQGAADLIAELADDAARARSADWEFDVSAYIRTLPERKASMTPRNAQSGVVGGGEAELLPPPNIEG